MYKIQTKTNLFLPVSIILSSVLVAGAILYTSNQGSNTGNTIAQIESAGSGRIIQVAVADTDPLIGDVNAPVTIIAFEDFECPFCERFSQQTLPLIMEQYVKTGKVRLVWKDFPLSIHSHAQEAHEAARCAWEQDKFWEYHDIIYSNQKNLGTNDFKRYAKDLGFNENQFSSCLNSGKYTSLIEQKIDEGNSIGVTGTPSFLINGRLVVGAQPFQVFADVINQALQQ